MASARSISLRATNPASQLALARRQVDIGLPDDFVRQVTAQLKSQSSALALMVNSVNKQVAVPQLQRHGGVLLSGMLSPESEAKSQAALQSETPAQE